MSKRKYISLFHQFYKELVRAKYNGYSILPLLIKFPIYVLQNRIKRDRLDLGIPWLVQDVINYLENNLKEGQRIFEFGSGASSIFFLRKGLELTSLEHDKSWFLRVNDYILKQGYSNFSLNLIEPEINTFKKVKITSFRDKRFFGYDYSDYANFILKFPDNYFDVILIDGRVRMTCLNNSLKKVKKDGIIILDNSERPDYIVNTEDLKLVYKSFGFVQYDLGFTETSVFKIK